MNQQYGSYDDWGYEPTSEWQPQQPPQQTYPPYQPPQEPQGGGGGGNSGLLIGIIGVIAALVIVAGVGVVLFMRDDDADVDLESLTRVGAPAQEIVACTESESIDHVVMGSRGRSGVTRILLGSVAEGVVRHSSAPVTVVR